MRIAPHISPNDPCPCHSGLKYKKCCRPYHNGQPAPTPLALMRSRYSAYALNKTEYIMQTTHPESKHYQQNRDEWRKELEGFSLDTFFAGLEILNVEGETVTFRAELYSMLSTYADDDQEADLSFTEKSRFRQHEGRWLYVGAEEERRT